MSTKLNEANAENDQDTYISERSSALSSNKRPSQPVIPSKEPRTLHYHYNQLPENGVPLATQYKQAKEHEKQLKKSHRKAPRGQGALATVPERPPDFSENYFPYTYYTQLRNPEKTKTHYHTADGYVVPNESLDLSRYVHEPAKSTSPKAHHRKSRGESTMYQYHPEKRTYESVTHTQKSPKPLSPPVQENDQPEPIPQHRTVKTHTTSSESKSHHHRHHHPHHQHHHHHSPEKEYLDAEFQVIDISFKKSQRSPFFSPSNNPFQLPPPNIYNVSSHLPPVSQSLPPLPSPSLHSTWQAPRASQSERSSNFYDRYLNKIIREKIN